MQDPFPHFHHPKTVHDYMEAALYVGLWGSEILLFEKYIQKNAKVLDLGCGAGRVAFGLRDRGYKDIIGVDISKEMIKEARKLLLSYGDYKKDRGTMPKELHDSFRLSFEAHSATDLPFDDDTFDSIIFSFNGLMQIPMQSARRQALREIHRVLKRDGVFIFTSHDRALSLYQDYWKEEKIRWENGTQDPLLMEFGNRACDTPSGRYFIHIPIEKEMREELSLASFEVIFTAMRSSIAEESEDVEDFSDDCCFWVVKKAA